MTDVTPPEPETSVSNEAFEQLRQRVVELEERAETDDVSLEAQHRQLLIQEIEQRIQFRQLVLILGVAVMVAMVMIIAHGMHKIMWFHFVTVPETYAVVLILAPTISVTTVMVTLLIGAFRRFKDGDADNIPSLAVEGVRQAANGTLSGSG